MAIVGTIAEIRRFAVKSMQGELIEACTLGPLGVDGDRRLALRNLSTGKIISAKVPRFGTPLLSCRATTTAEGSVLVTVGAHIFSFPDDTFALNAALSEFLGVDVAIVSPNDALSATLDDAAAGTGAHAPSHVYESEWPKIDGLALSDATIDLPLHEGTFADLASLHLVASSSIDHLATLAPIKLSADRFRPRLLIANDTTTAAGGFVENNWVGRTARIGEATVVFGEASPRCIMTTLAQPGLERDPRVLRTIAAHNRRDFGGFGNFACLGIYAEVNVPGVVRVGDAVQLLD